MKKLDVSQAISILANVGVIAGIVFLGFELEQNNSLLRAQASHSLLENRIRYRLEAVADDEVAQFWVRVFSGEELSPADSVRLRFHAETVILNWQFEYGQFVDGNLKDQPLETYRATIMGSGPLGTAYREVWRRWGQEDSTSLEPGFVEWMNKNVVSNE